MKWINICDDNYEPIDGQEYIVYMSDGGRIFGAYNERRKSFIEIHYGEEYSEDDVQFIALLTNPWVELKNEKNENTKQD